MPKNPERTGLGDERGSVTAFDVILMLVMLFALFGISLLIAAS